MRDEPALRMILDEAQVDLTRAVHLVHLLEAEGQREENLVHAAIVRVLGDELRVRAVGAVARVVELALELVLLLLERLALLRVRRRRAVREDRLVERADLRRQRLLHLEVGLRETAEELGTLRIARRGVLDDALRGRHLTPKEIELTRLDLLAVHRLGARDLEAGAARLLRGLLRALHRAHRRASRLTARRRLDGGRVARALVDRLLELRGDARGRWSRGSASRRRTRCRGSRLLRDDGRRQTRGERREEDQDGDSTHGSHLPHWLVTC